MMKFGKPRRWFVVTGLMLLGVIAAACTVGTPLPPQGSPTPPFTPPVPPPVPAAESETVTLYVGPNQVPCVGVAPQLCLQVKENPDDPYSLFYDQIAGFEYEPGYEYQLTVQKDRRQNVPADASAFTWTLVEEVSRTPVTATAPLEGTLWQLIGYTNAQGQLMMPLRDVQSTITFENGQVAGSGGCNNYFGSYTLDGNNLTITGVGSTMMACPEPIMAQEQAFLAGLANVATYQITGEQLHLFNANGDILMAFSPVVATPLTGTTWQVISYNNGRQAVVSVLGGTEMTAVFGEDGSLTGSAGCNNYMTSYEVDGNNITIGPAAATRKMCMEPEGIMDQEMQYLAALETAATYSIQGDTLELRTADGALVASYVPLAAVPLAGTRWQATGYNNGRQAVVSLLNGTEITAVFGEDGTLSGTAGCNNYSGGYQVDGNNITIGPMAATMMACMEPEGIMEQEMEYLAALETAATYSIQGDTLELRTADGALAATYMAAADTAVSAPAETAAPADQAEIDALKNISYTGTAVFTGTVQLTNGVYTATVPGTPMVASVEFVEPTAFGELDGQQAAAVILISNGGGSGVFYDLAAVLNQGGQWVNVATTLLGDRIDINSLAIENNQIVVDMVTQGPNDPMCCATQQVTQTYALEGDELLMTSSTVVGTTEVAASGVTTRTAEADLVGAVWNWTGNVYNNDTELTVDDPSRYTMELLADGTLALQVDCNRGGGTYTVEGSQLTLNVTTLTRVACPEGSLDTQFIESLNAAVSYVFDDGNLVINMKFDTGNMNFVPGAPAVAEAVAAPTSPENPAVPVVTAPLAGEPVDITGTTWQWVGFTDPVNGTQEITNPSRYTLTLGESGRARIQADCNRGAGTYAIDGSAITMKVTTLTRAMCPPGSKSVDFVKYLNGAAVYFVQDGDLFIDLFADSGTMRFTAAS